MNPYPSVRFVCLILAFTLVSHFSMSQKIGLGEKIPSFEVIDLKTDEVKKVESDSEKIILIDFWATWCGPCIAGMPHLESLQKTFSSELLVLAVSDESPERIKKFMVNRPFGFSFVSDKEKNLQKYFPHRIIPHTVLIDKYGEVIAITSPDQITEKTIRDLLDGEKPIMPLKQEQVGFDPSHDFFEVAEDMDQYFVIQKEFEGVPTFSKVPNQGTFANRRITAHNFSIEGLYRLAFQKSSMRLEYLIDKELVAYKPGNLYSVDVIVSKGSESYLYEYFAKGLTEWFEIKGKLEKRTTEVIVLYSKGQANLTESKDYSSYSGRSGTFQSEGASLNDLVEYLEDFDILGLPVVNETNLNGTYFFDLNFEPENPQSLIDALNGLGLAIKKESREIDVLVLYKD
ncbi:redoxin domain-containing protein [Aquiflexum gelatinilyticum]|uniref:Redoxin domain-containing protein n=1 Tax=Aquiflexum gelatinilyticum TaxID=2961943 RepID=A0A9X2P2A0_9BACT|nr:redoxin domain-containing protein [Aquiflexum gelatinilyticum]MCR9014529.1 redoxin domain-containing protein [Aquiflexum gelatinilyticum]